MSNSFALELQKGIRAALVADSGVTALVSPRIYDEPPQNVTYPFVRFGDIQPRSMDTDVTTGHYQRTEEQVELGESPVEYRVHSLAEKHKRTHKSEDEDADVIQAILYEGLADKWNVWHDGAVEVHTVVGCHKKRVVRHYVLKVDDTIAIKGQVGTVSISTENNGDTETPNDDGQ